MSDKPTNVEKAPVNRTKKVDVSATTTPKPRSRPPAAGNGRPKGAVNKITKDIREMIRQALDDAGGSKYLLEQAKENPVAFMGLVGKIVPKEVEAKISGELGVRSIQVEFVDSTTKQA